MRRRRSNVEGPDDAADDHEAGPLVASTLCAGLSAPAIQPASGVGVVPATPSGVAGGSLHTDSSSFDNDTQYVTSDIRLWSQHRPSKTRRLG